MSAKYYRVGSTIYKSGQGITVTIFYIVGYAFQVVESQKSPYYSYAASSVRYIVSKFKSTPCTETSDFAISYSVTLKSLV